ncbi:eukaryotic rRNA processing protein EBP2 [Onchocerca flexuosa]|uniref:Eukaryotic rRNA processing protein EBP2 n=1 Tax=Onchocerca flexuosa TaxID=387005 RepID=A0A238C257_9BILA|nr:eukaryotic rRNA processing protein EBP2 [Onchocerca flexuosa]
MLSGKRGEVSATDNGVTTTILSTAESEEESDSDRELQIAFNEGLLKSDKLNYVVEKKRPIINKKAELQDRVEKFKKNLKWLETLDVTVSNDHVDEKVLNNDFEREIIFYKQAEKAVQIAVSRLREMGVKIFRPTDYFAEMIRQRMAELEESKQKLEAIRRIREEKKFAAKVQKKVIDRKQNEKKVLAEAVKKHRKGIKSHLDAILNNAKRIQDTEEEKDFRVGVKGSEKERIRGKRTKKFRRAARDKKFGFGGQKKRSKKNDKNSFEEIATPGGLAHKLKRHHFGTNLLKNSAKRRKKR